MKVLTLAGNLPNVTGFMFHDDYCSRVVAGRTDRRIGERVGVALLSSAPVSDLVYFTTACEISVLVSLLRVSL